ncbi:MAG: hypothetical protein B6229_08240 [Spirochaetaceae bacterium 4572_7]|nr:MAG: hypothetical protein B6229_08240 [Spirochaetaceae bacterium 4572_7]
MVRYKKDSNYDDDLIRSVIIGGAFGFTDLFPKMLNAIDENRANNTTKAYIYKVFIMNEEDINNWFSYIEKDFD